MSKRFPRPAAFGRLCVETLRRQRLASTAGPAAFGRLCVETCGMSWAMLGRRTSRLRAAVC